MNQILNTNGKKKLKRIFILQFRVSIVFIIFGVIYIIRNIKLKEEENKISNIISLNAKLNSVFSSNIKENDNLYIGRIICDKINLDYFIFNEYSEENLKILPCKFSGGTFNENGNICIIAHNYFDNRFFSNIDKLEINDIVQIEDLNGDIYNYYVYKKYEINENEIDEVLAQEADKELTLCTCTFDKGKRLIIRLKTK